MAIDWGKIAGVVVGGVVNFFAPGAGAAASKLTEQGIDIASDVVAKIKAGKEGGKTESQIASELTPIEKAKLQGGVNEMSMQMSAQDEAFAAWIASATDADRKLSKWRKAAKIKGLDENAASTYSDDGTYLSYGKERIKKSDLVIFAGFPNYTSVVTVMQNAGDNMQGDENLMQENYYPDEMGGESSQESGAVPGGKDTSVKKSGSMWIVLLFLAAAMYWWFIQRPKEAMKARARKARNKKKQLQAEKEKPKPIVKPRKPVKK